VSDLLRPVHPVTAYLAADLGRAAHAAVTRFVVPVATGAVFFTLYLPHRWWTYLLFVVSALLGVVVSFCCRFLVNAAGYWLLDTRGVLLVWTFVVGALAGLSFPLHFLPPALTFGIWVFTPIPSMLQAPLDVLVEYGSTGYTFAVVGGQAVWAAAMLGICRYVQARADRRLVVQGG
jgi:ABC-2 type transport system permease protein